jgi:ketosteroid isomerase-like protein
MSNMQRIRDLYAAFAGGDIPAVLAGFAPNIEWREAEGNPYQPSGEAWVGAEAILQNLFARLGGDWEVFTVNPKAFHDAGAAVLVEARYVGRHKTTGKALDAQVCHVWKLEDGKITSFQQYTDTAQLQRVMRAGA